MTYGDISPALTTYAQAQMMKQMIAQQQSAKPAIDPIEAAQDADLIFELVKRGYAVGRLNEKNQLDV